MKHPIVSAFVTFLLAMGAVFAAPADAAGRAMAGTDAARHDAADRRYWQQATANLRADAAIALDQAGAPPPPPPTPAPLRK